MRIVQEIELRHVNAGKDNEPALSEVVLRGSPTGNQVKGAVLDGVVEWKGNWLLFVTEGNPFEDALHVHLLSSELQVLDSAMIGGPYSTGTFSDLQLMEPDVVSFQFIGDTNWRIELSERPRFRLPVISEPIGVWRKFGFSRRFVVRGDPKPEPNPASQAKR